jgi:hypothetical protein
MKVVAAQYTLDGSRLTVFFTAEDRVDFRDLVRDLSQHVHAQVQLRQVGPRDQAKIIGGYGRCGRRLCCTSWLTAFPTISIKMAKEQNLPLNPSKISGQCGRLLCCLSYENDVYKQLRAELPKPDSWLSTPSGNVRVLSVNAIKQIVVLQMENLQVVEVTVAQLGLSLGVARPLPASEVHGRPSALETAAPGTVHPPAAPHAAPNGRDPGRAVRPGQPRPQPAALHRDDPAIVDQAALLPPETVAIPTSGVEPEDGEAVTSAAAGARRRRRRRKRGGQAGGAS